MNGQLHIAEEKISLYRWMGGSMSPTAGMKLEEEKNPWFSVFQLLT
jgi:hypothetical protein